MALVLFDTNILIDYFAGYNAATIELASFQDAIISSLTWIEAACKLTLAEQRQFDALLARTGIKIVHMNDDIMLRATEIRRNSLSNPPKISLPDCVIRATAEASGRIVVTRNPADFGGIGPMVRVPYEMVNGSAVNIAPPPQ
jgi:predicted nucleic acid-binding protein